MHNIRPFLPSWKQWDQFLQPIIDKSQPKTFIYNGRVCFNHMQLANLIDESQETMFAILGMVNNTYKTYHTHNKTTTTAWVTTALLDGMSIERMYANASDKNYTVNKKRTKFSGKLYYIDQKIKNFLKYPYAQERYFLQSPWCQTRQGTFITGYGNIQRIIYYVLTKEMNEYPHTIDLKNITCQHTLSSDVNSKLNNYIKKYYPAPTHKLIFNGRDV